MIRLYRDPDPAPSGVPAGGTPQPETIPKTEFEKLKSETAQTISELKRQAEEAKMQLLDADYIRFLEDKKKVAAPAKPASRRDDPPQPNEEVTVLQKRLASVEGTLSNIIYHLELQDVKDRNADFEEYRDKVKEILETTTNDLTIEQAYKLAKAGAAPKEPEKKPVSIERPTSAYPADDGVKPKFKDETDAAVSAAREVMERRGISGDYI